MGFLSLCLHFRGKILFVGHGWGPKFIPTHPPLTFFTLDFNLFPLLRVFYLLLSIFLFPSFLLLNSPPPRAFVIFYVEVSNFYLQPLVYSELGLFSGNSMLLFCRRTWWVLYLR